MPTDSPLGQTGSTVGATADGLGIQGRFRALHDPTSPSNYINQAADSRLNSILKKSGSPLVTGIIQQTDDSVTGDQKYPYACRFLFNPGQITVGYSTAEGVTPPGELTPDQLKGTAVYAGQTSISFSLLFDRTYEVAYGPHTGLKDLRDVGVYEDIGFLESVTGVRTNFTAPITTTNDDGTTSTSGSTSLVGNMLMIPVYIIFGGGDGSYDGRPIQGLSYVGYITSMTVSYALFSKRMIPTRCGVDITVQQLLGKDFSDFAAKGGTILDRAHSRRRTSTSSGVGVSG